MRAISTSLVAAMVLLAGCGRQEAQSNAAASPRVGESTEEIAAEPGAVDPAAKETGAAADAGPGSVSPCLMQGSDRLAIQPFRALGTEPFWSARVEGRCVTYSTPEDQQGTRVWTRYSPGANGGGTWVGRLGGQPFELGTRAEPGCSDGMSDKRYPMAAQLTVKGEQRSGCAEPL
jgi:uncharacterized membrane protein